MGPATGWRPTVGSDRSVRWRTTAVAVVTVGAALLVGSAAMITLLRRSLIEDVRTGGVLRAHTIARDFAEGEELVTGGDVEEEFAQVIAEDGRVLASSENLVGHDAVVGLSPGMETQVAGLPFEDDPFLAVAVGRTNPDGSVTTFVVGRTLETAVESSQAVLILLAFGVPLMLAVVGAVTWRMVGRALSPVDAIRQEVESISARELHRRVPTPPSQDEIARLARTMNGMLDRLEGAQERQRRFVSDASHELRSPIATIRQHVEVAMTHPDRFSLDELAGVIKIENERLQFLVEDLLLLAEMDEGIRRPGFADVDLDDVLFSEIARARASGEIEIDAHAVSSGRISGDWSALSKLVRNLLDNAVRHANSRVTVGLGERGDRVVLIVEDDGVGVPAGDRERIFQRFERLDEARARDAGGSGLGLAIVAEVAAMHRAEVEVGDGVGGGARFEIRFPFSGRSAAVVDDGLTAEPVVEGGSI